MGVLLDHSRLFYSLVLAHLFHPHLPMVPALLSMAVCRRSSHLKAFYRQLHIAYLDCGTTVYMSFSNLYRASAIQRYIILRENMLYDFPRRGRSGISFLQAARPQPLIVVCNGQRLLFAVRLPTYVTVHGFTAGTMPVTLRACGIAPICGLMLVVGFGTGAVPDIAGLNCTS